MIETYQGDCLTLMKQIPDSSIDMILCDLPYGCTACKWDSVIPLEPLWNEYRRVIRPQRAIVLFGNLRFGIKLVESNQKWFRYEWIWAKNKGQNFLDCNKRPLINHEYVFVFCEKQPVYYPQKSPGLPYNKRRKGSTAVYSSYERISGGSSGGRFPMTVQRFEAEADKHHNTQKPVKLLEYMIKTYTQPGEVVLDNTMGSGSTGVACVNTDRSFIGIELDREYYATAVKRIDEAQIIKTTKLNLDDSNEE